MLITRPVCRTVLGLSCALAMLCASPRAKAEDDLPARDAELISMLRTAQLQDWLGTSISLEQSLCMQDELELAWPKSADAQLSERQHERLLQLR